ncbi:unnamed protein product [Cuscuta campestris]|uniref:cytokinin riboside 5'-monophosphate phosphoribohydrolase n=1 Tax=Cuscuta campestris TaxID=132261 RepID=A0A484M257_9ASTE|nr:unnamed protein product [Cuscuta campestris]
MATAVDLGRELVRRKIRLTYGGGNVGLQGAVASTIYTNGGIVRGFIPGYIAARQVYGPTYGAEYTVSSKYYKHFEMNHVVEAFIVLPRGIDTMEGLFTLISWASEGLHSKPIGLLNIDGYFNNLIKFLDDAVRQNFMASSQRKLFISSFFIHELLDKLAFAKAFPGPGASYDEFVNPGALDLDLHLDCKKHNLDNVAKAAIFKTLDPITFSKIKHLKTAMEIWQGLGKLREGSEDLRKQKIEVLLEKFKSFKMLPGESTAMEEGRNLENYTVQGLLDELRTYEHELKKKKEEQVTPFPTALMTTPRIPSSEGTCTGNCDTPSSSQPSSSKMENKDEEFVMMVKQFRKFKKFFKKADLVRRPSKGKPQVSDSPPESYLCYNCRKHGHWKSACSYPKVEKYGERERNEKKKKAMVAAESDESSSSSSDEEALVCMGRRVEKSNHEDRWTMSANDTLYLMAKDDADQEVTSQTSCSSYSIPTSENLFDQFKKMMKDFEEINLKHSSLTEENKLLSEILKLVVSIIYLKHST